ncbi:MAG: TIGR02300 family protein [Alphaproteobacteria bacterium]
MSTASNPMGLKRICTSCGARFYDLNKRPIICPSCDTEFTGEIKVKGRRGRAAAVVEAKEPEAPKVVEKDEDEVQEEDAGVEVVSLDDAEKPDDTAADDDAAVLDDEENLDAIPDFEGEIDDDIGDDDTLLDEDED